MISIKITEDSVSWMRSQRIFFDMKENKLRLKLGSTLYVPENAHIEPYTGYTVGNVLWSMGAFSYSRSILHPMSVVGRYTSIAKGLIVPGPRHPIERVSSSLFTYNHQYVAYQHYKRDTGHGFKTTPKPIEKAPPEIGHDVWIGLNVTIMPGVLIGNGAVVATNSVVTRDVPPFTVVGGNPAKVIKERFSSRIIAGLHDSQWWRYELKDFSDIDINSPESFLEQWKDKKKSLVEYNPKPINFFESPSVVADS